MIFGNLWRWLKYRVVPKYQHHIVRTGLEPGWHDVDGVMLHSCFALLIRYVEWECGGVAELDKWTADLLEHEDPNAPEGMQSGQAARQSEIALLYNWWKFTRPAEQKRSVEMSHDLYAGRKIKTEPVEGSTLIRLIPETDEGHLAKREELWALNDKIEADEQSMLHRLINVRQSLWT